MHSLSDLPKKKDLHLDSKSNLVLDSDFQFSFTVECNEPEGRIKRTVKPFIATLENIQRFWEKASKHSTLFGKEFSSGVEFMNMFFHEYSPGLYASKGLFWIVDDFEGMFYITDLDWPNDCLVHYSFFSGRHKGREPLIWNMIYCLFQLYAFHRLSAQIPNYVKPNARKTATDMGFIYEGKRRRCTQYKGKWFDVNLYGLLKEEFFNLNSSNLSDSSEVDDGKS